MPGRLKVVNDDVVINGNSVFIQDIPFATTADMDIYVRAIDGNDSNPGTSALPLATIQKAWELIPQIINHIIRIHVGPHTGSGYSSLNLTGKTLNNNVYLIGDGGGGTSDGFVEIIGSTLAGSGSTQEKVVTSGLSTSEYGGLGELWGRTIEIIDGLAAGDRRHILYNTTTEIFPNVQFSGVVSPGDSYRILEPEATIYSPGEGTKITNIGEYISVNSPSKNRYGLWLINLNFDDSGNVHIFNVMYSSVYLIGITCNKGIALYPMASSITSGVEGSVFSAEVLSPVTELADVPNTKSWLGWGLTLINSSNSDLLLYEGGICGGSFNSGNIQSQTRSTTYVIYGSFWSNHSGACIRAYTGSFLYVFSLDANIIIGTLSGCTSAVKALNADVVLVAYKGSNSLILRSSGNTVVSAFGSRLIMTCISNYIYVDSGGIGLLPRTGGYIGIDLSTPTINSVVGDFSINDGITVHPISVLTSGKLYKSLQHGSVQFDGDV